MLKFDKQKFLATDLADNFSDVYTEGGFPCIKCSFLEACGYERKNSIYSEIGNSSHAGKLGVENDLLFSILNKYESNGFEFNLKDGKYTLEQKEQIKLNLVAELEEHGLVEFSPAEEEKCLQNV